MQEGTQLRVSRGMVLVVLKMVPWAILNSSPMGGGGCEPWQGCVFLLLLHTACGADTVELWWAVVEPRWGRAVM